MGNKTKPIHLNMPEDLWRKAKSLVALQGTTLTQLIIKLLEKEVGGK